MRERERERERGRDFQRGENRNGIERGIAGEEEEIGRERLVAQRKGHSNFPHFFRTKSN